MSYSFYIHIIGKYKQLYMANFNFFIKYWADTKSIYVTYKKYNE